MTIYYKDGQLNKKKTATSLLFYYLSFWVRGKNAPKIVFESSLRDLRSF